MRIVVDFALIMAAVSAVSLATQDTKPPAPEKNGVSPVVTKATADGIDLVVDRMVAKGKRMDDKDWAIVTSVYRVVETRAKTMGYSGFQGPDFSKLPVLVTRKVTDDDLFPVRKRAVAQEVAAVTFGGCLVLCNGPVETELGAIGESVIFANGRIAVASSLADSIVVCNRDVEIGALVRKSIVISRGNISIRGHVVDSVLCAFGDIEIDSYVLRSQLVSNLKIAIPNGYVDKSTIFAGGVLECDEIKKGSFVTERTRMLPKLIDFFNPASLGLEVAEVQGEIRLSNVRPDSASAKGGFVKGDIILGLPSAEEFRNQLRKSVIAGRGTFFVRRDKKVVELAIAFGN